MNKLSVAALLLSLAACQDQQIAPAARFRGPTDTVAAGSKTEAPQWGEDRTHNYVYMTGGVRDALYVMFADVGNLRAATFGSFVRAPNKFFPLEIPFLDPSGGEPGRLPSALGATADGRFVLAVCTGDRRVWLVDADAQSVVLRDGVPLTAPIGHGATSIVSAPANTANIGVDRFYVANAVDRSVDEIVLDRSGDSATFTRVRTFTDVGSIARMAISDDGELLFGADASGPAVHRLNLRTGAVVDIDVGGPSLDVAVHQTGDGEPTIYVARPDTLSVELFTASGARVDTNPRYTPLLLDNDPFPGIYIGDVPSRISIVKEAAGIDATIRCGANDGAVLQQFAIVATDAGRVYYINLDPTPGTISTRGVDMPVNALVDRTWCVGATVAATTNSPTLFAEGGIFPFEPCPEALGRARSTCLAGVTMARGNFRETRYTLIYEGVLPGLDRSNGGGTLANDGNTLIDVSLDLTQAGLEPSDYIVITNEPALNPGGCQGEDGYSSVTSRRFKITSSPVVNPETRRAEVTIAPEFPRPANTPPLTACFPTADAAISYEIRPKDTFLVTSTVTDQPTFFLGRLQFGQAFGSAGEPVRFKLRAKAEIDPKGDLLTPGQPLEFLSSAPFASVAFGLVTPNDGSGTLPAGRIPTSIVYGAFGDQGSSTSNFITLVTFGGNDTVIGFDPSDSDNALSDVYVLR